MPIPGTPTGSRPYRIKKTDNALTLPGRVTFPQGSYVSSPMSNLPRLPYQQGTGTQVSGLAGAQGASSSMYPQTSSPTITPFTTPQYGNYRGQTGPMTPAVTPQYGNYRGQTGPMAGVNPLGAGGPTLYPSSNPGVRGPTTINPGLGGATQPTAPVPQTVPTQGAAPFGVNAFGERLDSKGDVWNPATAQTDIYGGRFIQVGETRWERNAKGRLVKVKYLGGGKKQVVKGNPKDRRANQQAKQAPQQQAQDQGVASQFVSFRA